MFSRSSQTLSRLDEIIQYQEMIGPTVEKVLKAHGLGTKKLINAFTGMILRHAPDPTSQEELERQLETFVAEYIRIQETSAKTEVVRWRLTPGEKERIEQAASDAGFANVSDYQRTLNGLPPERPPATPAQMAESPALKDDIYESGLSFLV